jgi:hypothetical protein
MPSPIQGCGGTPGSLISANSTNATSVKAAPGTLLSVTAYNLHATLPRFLKFYNKASAPTVGTDTPIARIALPPVGAGNAIPLAVIGMDFSLGIAFALTTGAADNDTGAVAASEILVNYTYR